MYRSTDMHINSRRTAPSHVSILWLRIARSIIATAKCVYPVVLVLAMLATALAMTIALRLALWLPMYLTK